MAGSSKIEWTENKVEARRIGNPRDEQPETLALCDAAKAYYIKWRSERKRPVYAYHATRPEYLASIRRAGLVPKVPNPEERSWKLEGAVFFAPEEESALYWGEVLLRFPWPQEAEDDCYGDATILDDEVVVNSSCFVMTGIAASVIEVLTDRGWEKLVGDEESSVAGTK